MEYLGPLEGDIEFSGTTGRSATNNNPLNLEYRPGSYQDKYDAELEPVSRSGKQRFAKFPTMEMGYQAGIEQIQRRQNEGHTLASFVNQFAPPHENPTQDIIAQYSKATGASPDTPLSDIPAEKLIVPMLARESSTRIVSKGGGVLKAIGDVLGPNSAEASTGGGLKYLGPLEEGEPTAAGQPKFLGPEPAGKVDMRPPGIYESPEIDGMDYVVEKLGDYLGFTGRSQDPGFKAQAQIEVEAKDEGLTVPEYKRLLSGAGERTEFANILMRYASARTLGLTDAIDKFINGDIQKPTTAVGTFLGAGGELAGFIQSPYAIGKAITGTRLAPTAQGLRGTVQLMTHGAATLGAASAVSSVIPSFLESDNHTDQTLGVLKSAGTGALIGAAFPVFGLVPTKPLRLAIGIAAMDMYRAKMGGGKQGLFTLDDTIKGLEDGTIDRKELAQKSFDLLMDIYFIAKTPSMKAQLAEIAKRNPVAEELSKVSADEAEQSILEITGGRQPIPDIGTGERGDIRIGQVKPKQKPMSEEQVLKGAEIGFEKYPKPEWTEIKKRFDEQMKAMEGQPLPEFKPFWEIAHDIEVENRAEIILAGAARPRAEAPLQATEIQPVDTKVETKAIPESPTPLPKPEVVAKEPWEMTFTEWKQWAMTVEDKSHPLYKALRAKDADVPLSNAWAIIKNSYNKTIESAPGATKGKGTAVKEQWKILSDRIGEIQSEWGKEKTGSKKSKVLMNQLKQAQDERHNFYLVHKDELPQQGKIDVSQLPTLESPTKATKTAPAEGKPGWKGLIGDESGAINIPNPFYKHQPPRVAVSPEAQRVEGMYDNADVRLEEIKRSSWGKLRDKLVHMTVDVSGNVKRALLKEGGALGQDAIMRHDAVLGASAKSAMILEKAGSEIYGDLTPEEHLLLDRVIQSRRIIAIESYRPDVKNPGDLSAPEHQRYLDDIPRPLFNKLNAQADKYFKIMRDNLTQMKDAGLITQEGYDKLKDIDYQKREFEQYLDPDRTYFIGGKKITVPDSGIQRLEEGSTHTLETDSQLLMAHVVNRTQARIAKNNANLALLELAKQMPPDFGIVRLPKYGEKPGAGETWIKVMDGGVAQEMIMPEKFAREWVTQDPLLNRTMADIVGWLSGAKILRATSTGFNPSFALANVPRDIIHNWLVSGEYSKNLPDFFKEIASDYKAIWGDAVQRTGAYEDFINEGGGMNFLTHQGRLTNQATGIWKSIQDYAGWIGETSEILNRLAVRNRAIRNGKTPEEGTWIARTALDFSQGGSAIKAADAALPYLNAGVQATRAVAKAAWNDPATFTWKVAQIGAIAAGLYLANTVWNKEAWDQVPATDKVNGFIITTPLTYIDKNGDKKYLYFKIAKDQSIRIVSTLIDGLMAKFMGHDFDTSQITNAATDLLAYVPTEKMPPTMAAAIGYAANKDFWRNRDVWRGPKVESKEEFTNYTNPSLIKIGGITGMSPERMGYALSQVIPPTNTFASLVGSGLRKMLDTLPDKDRQKSIEEIVTSIPGIDKVIRSTDPMAPFKHSIDEFKMESTTKSYKQRRDFDTLLEDHYAKPTAEKLQKLIAFKNSQPEENRDKLDRHYKEYKAYRTIPNSRWWMELKHASPEARANGFLHRFNSSTPDEQKALWEQAKKLPGIVTDNFVNELKKVKEGATQ